MMHKSLSTLCCAAAVLVFGVRTASALQDESALSADARSTGAPRLLVETKHGRVLVDLASAPLLRNRIRVDFSNMPIRDALADVARKAAIRLMYADDIIPVDAVVRLRAEGITVAAALTDILDGTGVDVVFTSPGDASLIRHPPSPPVGTLEGTVKDGFEQPIVAATLLVEGTQLGAISDAEGKYKISGVRAGTQTITARRIGYQPLSKNVVVHDGANVVDFVLATSATSLKALVVTGTTGAVERVTQAAVVASVDAADLQSVMPASDPMQLLVGTVSGANVSATGGQAGDAIHMFIRGPSSVYLNNEPLVFVDGVRVNSTPRALLGLGGQQADPLENLNPDDIASMEIVKGPAASTLYGADASAGVINILTKRGGIGKLVQSITIDGSQSDVGYTPWVNYGKCSASAVLSTSKSTLCQGLTAGSVVKDSPLLRTGAFRIGDGGKVDYSVRGGGSDFGYFVSASASNEQGVEVPNGLHGYTARGNFFWTATPKLTFNLGMNLADNDNFLSAGDQANGSLATGGGGGSPLTVSRTSSGALVGGWYQSPGTELQRINSLLNEYHTRRSTPDVEVSYKPWSWFNNRLRLGADVSQVLANSYSPIDAALTGTAALGSATNLEQASNVYTLDYNGTIHADLGAAKALTSDLTFGAQYIETDLNTIGGLGQSFITDAANLAGLAASTAVTGQSVTTQKSLGLLLQEDLGFSKKYFTQIGVRFDKNSSFGAAAPWFVLPKIGVSYVMSEEPFWKTLEKTIPTFRLRAAWGSTGRSPPPGASLQTYSAAAYVVGATVYPGVSLKNPGNANLKAELGQEFEGGFDATFFHERASLEVTFFDKTSNNLLLVDPLPPSDGYPTGPWVNIGKVNNRGWEVSLRATPVTMRQVTWDLVLSGSTLRNEVVTLGNIAPFTSLSTVAAGYPLGSLFTNAFVSTNTAANTNVVTDQQVYQGNSNPSLIANFANTVTLFGRLKLYALFTTQRGFTIFNYTEENRDYEIGNAGAIYLPYGQGGYSPTEMTQIFGKSVTQSGTPITMSLYNPLWMQGGDFVRLEQLSATLVLPNGLVRSIGGNTASFTFGATNLRTWTNPSFHGLDPSASSFTSGASGGGPGALVRLDAFAAPPPIRWFGRFTFTF